MGVMNAQTGTRTTAGSQCADLDLGVCEQQTEDLSAGVAAGTSDRYPNRHTNNYAHARKVMLVRSGTSKEVVLERVGG